MSPYCVKKLVKLLLLGFRKNNFLLLKINVNSLWISIRSIEIEANDSKRMQYFLILILWELGKAWRHNKLNHSSSPAGGAFFHMKKTATWWLTEKLCLPAFLNSHKIKIKKYCIGSSYKGWEGLRIITNISSKQSKKVSCYF